MKLQTVNLLKKEIILGNSLQTVCWLVCCFGMFFIPSYPAYIGPFYITLSIMMTFALNQASHDILYTVLLPVRKIDTVKARFLYCGLLEVVSILFPDSDGCELPVSARVSPYPASRKQVIKHAVIARRFFFISYKLLPN